MSNQRGFTLIELMVVIVILGVIAAIAIPKFSNTKQKAHRSAAIADLRNLAPAQEAFYTDSNRYGSTADLAAMKFSWSQGNTSGVITGDATKWNATVTDAGGKLCAVYYNQSPAAPATVDGVPACQP